MEKILVAGANGTTGKMIVQQLHQAEVYVPVAMVRKHEQTAQFELDGIEVVLADLEQDLSFALNDVDKVIFAAGSGGQKVKAVDRDGAKRLIDAAKKHGVKKFVMLSSIGADKPEEADELQEYLKAKHQADEYLKNSGLSYTILRPGSLNNEEATHKIRGGKHIDPQGEIPRADVANVLVHCLPDDVAPNVTFEILSGDHPIKEILDTIS
ncbi:SDR family oxidoreductase [Gangjinia marincola]|uniref:SDR family oxidoreductase n=1 Tax=Gangjinia marincola TaxID=578463 RepID=A0ABN1MF09_9FLAO